MVNIAEDIRESAESLLYVINNPDNNIIEDIKGIVDDLKFLSDKLSKSDDDLF